MFTILTTALLSLQLAPPAAPHDVYGIWETDNGATVEIMDCEGSPCGFVRHVDVYELEPEAQVVQLLDYRNPDRSLRDRPIIGMQMIGDFERADENWRRGYVYSPEWGRTIKISMTRLNEKQLEVRGCITVICQSQYWTQTTMTPAKEEQAKLYSPGGGMPTAYELGLDTN